MVSSLRAACAGLLIWIAPAVSVSVSGPPKVASTQADLGAFHVSPQLHTYLRRHGIVSLRGLLEQTSFSLLRKDGLGKGSVQEIEAKLGKRGLKLGDSFDGPDVFISARRSPVQMEAAQLPQLGVLQLTSPTLALLESAKIRTLHELLKRTPNDLMEIEFFEHIHLLEIMVRLRSRELMLGDELEGDDIALECKPPPSKHEPLRLEPKLYAELRALNVITLKSLLREARMLRTYLGSDSLSVQQIQVALAERGLQFGQSETDFDVPLRSAVRRKIDLESRAPSRFVKKNQAELGPLKLTARTYNCLCDEGIVTLRTLLAQTLAELAVIRNLGPKCLTEIEQALADRGLNLGDEFPGPDVSFEMIKKKKLSSDKPANQTPLNEPGLPIEIAPTHATCKGLQWK